MQRLVPIMLACAVLTAVPGESAAQRPAAKPPEDAGYLFLVARRLADSDKLDEAIATLQRAAALAPESAEVRAELASIYVRQDKPVEAVNAAEQALERNPDHREANRILGTLLAALVGHQKPLRPTDDSSQYQSRAIAALEKAKGDGSDLDLLLTLGQLQLRAGQHDRAADSLRRVIEVQPRFTDGVLLLSSAQEGAGRFAEAADTLEAASRATPSSFRVLIRLTELYERQRRWKEAASAYERAQAANPRADLTAGRAAALMNGGAPAQARELLQDAIARRQTPDVGLLYLLAESQRLLKDLDAADATVKQLLEWFPADPRGLVIEAQLKLARGRREEALAAFAGLVKRLPNEPNVSYQYAQLLEDSGRVAEAERVLRDLISRDPGDATALNSLGYMFADRGVRLEEAVDLLQRALKIEPGNPSFLDSLGWAFVKQGRLAEADKPLTDAAAQMPGNPVIQDHLGDLRFRQKRLGEAIAAWERALSGDGEQVQRSEIERKLRETRVLLPKR